MMDDDALIALMFRIDPMTKRIPPFIRRLVHDVILIEREACAKLCEENVVGLTRREGISAAILYPFYDKESGGKHEGMTYAKAIRERGE
jgi:hypothetical protein